MSRIGLIRSGWGWAVLGQRNFQAQRTFNDLFLSIVCVLVEDQTEARAVLSLEKKSRSFCGR